MRRTTAVLLVVVALAGCRSTPSQDWYTAASIYTDTLNLLSDLRQQGKIDAQAYHQIEEVRIVARAALDEAEAQIARGAPRWQITSSLNAASKALEQLIAYRAKYGRS